MADRSTMLNSLKNLAMKVTLEEMDGFYKSYSPIYSKIAQVKPITEIKGSYAQMTSVIGSTELVEREENEAITFENPTEGYPVYIKKRSYDLGIEITMELDRDFEQIKNFFTTYLKEKNIPKAVARTKEKVVASLFNNGGNTSGHAIFGNAVLGVNTPSYGNYVYDSKPFFNISGNNRSAKAHSTTYYNGLASTYVLNYDNLQTADLLLISTNAKMENGEPFDNTQGNMLMVPPALSRTATKLLDTEKDPTNANNTVNPIKGEYTKLVNPYLTSATQWFIGNKNGLVFYDSNNVVYDIWYIHETRKIRGSAHIDLGVGVVNWRAWAGGAIAES